MKQSKKLLFTLCMLGVLTIIAGIYLYNTKDFDAPTIKFEINEITYTKSSDESILMVGVSAYDLQDGDLTDVVEIEKIMLDERGKKVYVVYCVCDKSGNLAKETRTFDYEPSEGQ